MSFRGIKQGLRRKFVVPVVKGAGADLYVERGDIRLLTSSTKIAIVASWADQAVMSKSLSEYIFELDRQGYVALVVFSGEIDTPLVWPHHLPEDTVIVRRRNIGYDFGSWAAVLNALPEIRSADRILLTNDSMLGPFAPMDTIFCAAESDSAGLFVLTDTFQMGPAVQSYFLLFKDGILDNRDWRQFFNSVRPESDKMQVVYRYENSVAKICVRGGYGWIPMFPAQILGYPHANPTLRAWKELLDLGSPFVKRTLLTHPQFTDQIPLVASQVEERFGQDVFEWMPQTDAKRENER